MSRTTMINMMVGYCSTGIEDDLWGIFWMLLLFSLLSGRSFQVFGRAKYVNLFTWSVLANGMYRWCLFLRSWSCSWPLVSLVIQVLCSAAGLYLWYMECMRIPLVSVIRWSRGRNRIPRLTKIGLEGLLYLDLVIALTAFFAFWIFC